jgi:hypothetical protein
MNCQVATDCVPGEQTVLIISSRQGLFAVNVADLLLEEQRLR